MRALMNWLKENGGKHLEGLVIAAALIFVGRMWLQEHDQRLQADTQVKTAEVTIAGLQKQQSTVAQAAKVQIVTLRETAAAVKTPEQAVAALQKDTVVQAVLPTLEPVADTPELVKVSAVELFKGVNACEQSTVTAAACTKELDTQKDIDTQKDTEIKALKKKPGFWRRLGKAAKVVGCSAAGGYAGSLAGKEGAAIGAAAGAGVCQMF